MNIAYHYPSYDHIYAQRTIYEGFKSAFTSAGHIFYTFTNGDNIESFFEKKEINIFITSSNYYYQKALDRNIINIHRSKGLKVFVKIDRRKNPLSNLSLREGIGLSREKEKIKKISKGLLGDYFFSVFEPNDPRIIGFTETTGQPYHCIPLGCNPDQQFYDQYQKYHSKLAFLGSWSNNKKQDFQELLYPLKKKGLKLYGQDWTWRSRRMGDIQRVGQYFNIDILSRIQKPKLSLDIERIIYSSADISLNIHERQQKRFGGDCNERLFKIPACGGFQITDDVACIHKYLEDGKEIVIAKDKDDRFAKIDYYMSHPEERAKIAEAGRKRVLKDHTYNNRVEQILNIYYGNHD